MLITEDTYRQAFKQEAMQCWEPINEEALRQAAAASGRKYWLERMQLRMTAVQSLHPRLGIDSWLGKLETGIFWNILDMALPCRFSWERSYNWSEPEQAPATKTGL